MHALSEVFFGILCWKDINPLQICRLAQRKIQKIKEVAHSPILQVGLQVWKKLQTAWELGAQ